MLLAYAGVGSHGFVNFDDPEYVYENPPVVRGITIDGVRWALTAVHSANWHPLTWLSHMLDAHLFGLDAGWHHRTNVALHALATVCLFAALRAMRLSPGRSAFVAALFALHPRNVESVAWISERKDVLSAVFWTAAMWAYALYARRTTLPRYLAVLALFVCGVLAKPMVVTLPAALLLLDVWPLRRLRVADVGTAEIRDVDSDAHRETSELAAPTWVALVVEKLPLFAVALAAAVITFLAQRSSGAVATLDALPLAYRLQNAVVVYVAYLRSLVWPVDLAVFYPYRALPAAEVTVSALVLLALSVLAWRSRRARPYLLVGWLWYLGTLVPVIGIVKAGDQAMADRFTYLPAIGIFLAVTWTIADAASRVARLRRALAPAALVVLVACLVATRAQLAVWRDSVTLFEHALAVTTPRNHLAHLNLAAALVEGGRAEAAIDHAEAAAALRPESAKALTTLAIALAGTGRPDEARAAYERALRAEPDSTLAWLGFGVLLAERGQWAEAERAYDEVLRRDPRHAKAHAGLGFVFASQGRTADAIVEYRAALAIDPGLLQAHNGLALALEESGAADEALRVLASAVERAPDESRLRFNYAAMLRGRGRTREAAQQYDELLRREPQNARARAARDELRETDDRDGGAAAP